MSLNWEHRRLLRVVAPVTSRTRDTIVLATVLVVGLVAVAPATAWFLGLSGLTDPIALIVGVALVGGLYGLLLLVVGRVALGTAVAVVVTVTFAADLPLAAGASDYPGSLGPELWLVHGPLLALVGLLAIRGEFTLDSTSWVEYAFAAFVLWTVVVALLGPVPRRDVALYYSLFSLVALVSFAAARRSVESDVVSFPGLLGAFLVAVAGHVAFATVQLANQGLLGLSVLGETTRGTSHNVVGLGPFGGFEIGVFVSGLAGGNGALALQIVLALPIALAVAARLRGLRRSAVLGGVVVATAILRFTAKDAARGAAVVAMVLIGAYLLWEHRSRLGEAIGRWVRTARWVPLVVLAGGALFIPSTITKDGTGGPEAGDGGDGIATDGPGEFGAAGAVDAQSLSIPFFNLNTLGIRLQQYVVGLDIFVRHPLSGIGGANFTYAAARYDLPALSGVSMHSLYLSLLVGTGIPGFTLYVAALLLVLWAGWRLLRSAPPDRVLVAGVLAALVGYLAASFWVLPLRFTHVLPFWILAGALVGRARRSADAFDDEFGLR